MFSKKVGLIVIIIICLFLPLTKVYEEKICIKSNYDPVKYFNQVALTFDDGPHPEYTQKIVDILVQHKVKATFFVVGKQVQKYPQLVKYILENSDSKIGNHTYTHRNLKKIKSEEVYLELLLTKNLLLNIAGEKYKHRIVPFFRPPGGHYNSDTIFVADKIGLKVLLWSVFTNDHCSSLSKEELINKILKSVNGKKEIILLHSGSDVTLESLPQIIQILKQKNYIFVTVDEIIKNGETFLSN